MLTKLSSDFTKFVNQSTLRFHYSELRHIQVMDNSPVNGGSMSGLERIPTHIEGLDENMQGGIPQGHICLVAGASGAMKSSLTFSMLYNAVLYGETSGIYITLEQGKESLRAHMSNMGMNVDDPRV
ncbi:MAG: ATPase domain-containing protein, partial [Candidatus Thermoplasmatota archaeon]|nr:ATPase domain-containing protein [Candidatus Thermoplasmatota archaeon]